MDNSFVRKLWIFYSKYPVAISGLITFASLGLDYLTGRRIHFPIFYILPVAILAWTRHPKVANTFAIILPLARIGFYYAWEDQHLLYIASINALITGIVLAILSLLIINAAEKRELEKRLQHLEGILPICSSCKRIRNEQGEYDQLEKYITGHSQASFTHGICPECAKKLYPGYVRNEDNAKK